MRRLLHTSFQVKEAFPFAIFSMQYVAETRPAYDYNSKGVIARRASMSRIGTLKQESMRLKTRDCQ
jgi:hypothetical protein